MMLAALDLRLARSLRHPPCAVQLDQSVIATTALVAKLFTSSSSPLHQLQRGTAVFEWPTVIAVVSSKTAWIHDLFALFGAPDIGDAAVVDLVRFIQCMCAAPA